VICQPMVELEAQPEAIFFPKFENATEQSRQLYRKLAAAQDHVLAVAVKSSGSLFLATARAGALVVSSKNGMGNVYADCGHLVLIRHLQEAHGAAWRCAYQDLVDLLEEHMLSLGCELVTRSLGDHAETPAKDHLVVNAVLDRRTMLAVSPVLVLRICRHFGLVAPGIYLFRGPDSATKFLQIYDRMRWETDATWGQLHAAMSAAAWRTADMPYAELHSQVLEGYVCSWIPLSPELEVWAAQSDAKEELPTPSGRTDSGLRLNSLVSVLPSPGVTQARAADDARSCVPTLDDLFSALKSQYPEEPVRQLLGRLQSHVQDVLRGQGAGAPRNLPGLDSLPPLPPHATPAHTLQKKVMGMLACASPLASDQGAGQGAAGVAGCAETHSACGARGFLRMLGAAFDKSHTPRLSLPIYPYVEPVFYAYAMHIHVRAELGAAFDKSHNTHRRPPRLPAVANALGRRRPPRTRTLVHTRVQFDTISQERSVKRDADAWAHQAW